MKFGLNSLPPVVVLVSAYYKLELATSLALVSICQFRGVAGQVSGGSSGTVSP